MQRHKPFIIISLFIIFSSTLHAHTLILKNGQRIKGKIVNQTKTEIHIQVGKETRIIPKTEIQEVDYADTKPIVKPKEVIRAKPAWTPPTEKAKRPLNQRDLLWRSAVLPGWGQYMVNEKKTAYREGAITFVLLINGIKEYQKKVQQESIYQDKVVMNFALVYSSIKPGDDPLLTVFKNMVVSIEPYNTYQDQVNKANLALRILGIAYIGQLYHSWVLGKKNVANENPVLTYNFGFFPSANQNGRWETNSYFGIHYNF